MKLADFYPFVVPHVPDVPLPTVDLHIRQVARDFFKRTHAWQMDLDPFAFADGTVDYEIAGPAGSDIAKVLTVVADEVDYAKATSFDGNNLLTFDGDTPINGLMVEVRIALTPKGGDLTKAWTLPTSLDGYTDDIAKGVLASLLPTQPERKGDAVLYGTQYADRVRVIGINVSRRFGRRRAGSSAAAQMF